MAAKLHRNGILRALDLPWIAVFQPAVRLFGLIPTDDLLPKQAEAIANAHAHTGDAQMGHRIQKTGRQAAKAAVAQSRILLAGTQLIQIDAKIAEPLPNNVLHLQIDQVVFQQTANEELHGKIMDLLLLEPNMPLGGLGPYLTDRAGQQIRQHLILLKGRAFLYGLRQCLLCFDAVGDLKFFFSCEHFIAPNCYFELVRFLGIFCSKIPPMGGTCTRTDHFSP